MRLMAMGIILMAAAPTAAAEVVELDAKQRERAGVVVAPVVERGFGDSQRVVGQVIRVPGSTLTLKAVIPGRVEDLRVAPGDRVRAGEMLVALHAHELLTMQAGLLQARDRASLAATRLEAGRELYAIEGISRLDLQVREQEAWAAELDFTITREELLDHGFPEAALEDVLEHRTTDAHLPIIAPTDGVVLELAVEDQEWVEEYRIRRPQLRPATASTSPRSADRISSGRQPWCRRCRKSIPEPGPSSCGPRSLKGAPRSTPESLSRETSPTARSDSRPRCPCPPSSTWRVKTSFLSS